MRYLLVAVLLAACSSAAATSAADPTDARICAAALQVPWNSPLITSLTRDPQTDIQREARVVQDKFDNVDGTGGGLPAWNQLSKMCVDAGF